MSFLFGSLRRSYSCAIGNALCGIDTTVNKVGDGVRINRKHRLNSDVLGRHFGRKSLPFHKCVSFLLGNFGQYGSATHLLRHYGIFLPIYQIGKGIYFRRFLIAPIQNHGFKFVFLTPTVGNQDITQRCLIVTSSCRIVGRNFDTCHAS